MSVDEGKQSPIGKAVVLPASTPFDMVSGPLILIGDPLGSSAGLSIGPGLPELNQPHFLLCPNATAADLYAEIQTPGGAKGDSGTDIRFPADLTIPPSSKTKGRPTVIDMEVRARLRVVSLIRDEVHFFPYQLVPRSSIGKTPLGLANSVGIIDRGYLGTLKVAVRNFSDEPYEVKRGESLFQLIVPTLTPVSVVIAAPGHNDFAEAGSLRGSGGLGSTGAGGTGATKEK